MAMRAYLRAGNLHSAALTAAALLASTGCAGHPAAGTLPAVPSLARPSAAAAKNTTPSLPQDPEYSVSRFRRVGRRGRRGDRHERAIVGFARRHVVRLHIPLMGLAVDQ